MTIFVALVPKFKPQGRDEGTDCFSPSIARQTLDVDFLRLKVLGLKSSPLCGHLGEKRMVPSNSTLLVEELVIFGRNTSLVKRNLGQPASDAVGKYGSKDRVRF